MMDLCNRFNSYLAWKFSNTKIIIHENFKQKYGQEVWFPEKKIFSLLQNFEFASKMIGSSAIGQKANQPLTADESYPAVIPP